MKNFFIMKKDIGPFLKALSRRYGVFAPQRCGEHRKYMKVEKESELPFDYINTQYPPKRFFIPDGETLFTVRKTNDSEVNADIGRKKRILFGVRPCDVNGLLVLDRLFIKSIKDPYYSAGRKGTMIFAVECEKTGPNCMCKDFGTEKVESGFDLLFRPSADGFYVIPGSAKGRMIAEKHMKEYKETVPEQKKLVMKKRFPLAKAEKIIPSIRGDKRWEDVAKRCLSCAGCTISCPTCHCFEVSDSIDFEGHSERKKFWTSCMHRSFTSVAKGHAFRSPRTERIKQFVYHKLMYYRQRHDSNLCVGCGRCVSVCPSEIDFFKEVERMIE